MNNEFILRTEALRIGYSPQKPLLEAALNLEIKSGQFIGLLGTNGMGKSTLLHTLVGLLPALSGQVFWENTPLAQFSARERAKKIALVLSPRPTAPTLRVHEVIRLGRYPYQHWQSTFQSKKEDEKYLEKALADTELSPLADRKLYTLSDGEHQKVMIARALAQNTPLIMLDEPTAHLDLPNRVMIFQLLRRLCQTENKALLTTTHELSLALQVSDVLWLIDKRGTMHQGSPEDLVLQGKFTSAFPEKGFFFDKKTGNFQIQYNITKSIRLEAEGEAAYWTRLALEKNGFQIDPEATKYSISILQKNNNELSWKIKSGTKEYMVSSILALINYLKNE